MRQYELMYILHPDLEEENLEALVNRFRDLVTNEGGEVIKLDRWGRRRLAYEINRARDGFYVVMKFKARTETADELSRVLKITDGVLRHIITREDQ
ncbi:MAG: 30S ribosomal protein S6 [Thermoanaerobacterales bacterium]|nr:30S ribosomal protein S6 [Bacillota bacterium]MDI6907731.1 30S ribosomal protein S6 [Thermoanaerobacterales bacterium]